MACFCLELDPATADPLAPQLLRTLALLVQLEKLMPASCAAIRQQVVGTDQALPLADVIAAIVISRFNGRSLKELCAVAVSPWRISPKAWRIGRSMGRAGKRSPPGPCRRSGWRRRRGDPNATAN